MSYKLSETLAGVLLNAFRNMDLNRRHLDLSVFESLSTAQNTAFLLRFEPPENSQKNDSYVILSAQTSIYMLQRSNLGRLVLRKCRGPRRVDEKASEFDIYLTKSIFIKKVLLWRLTRYFSKHVVKKG